MTHVSSSMPPVLLCSEGYIVACISIRNCVMSETKLMWRWKRARIIWKDIVVYHPLSDEETVAEVLEVVIFHNYQNYLSCIYFYFIF